MIVVTGSNGFIGSNLIKNLNALGFAEILAVDNHDDEDLKENIKDCQISEYLGIDEFLTLIKNRNLDSEIKTIFHQGACSNTCLLYTSPSPRDGLLSRMPSSA